MVSKPTRRCRIIQHVPCRVVSGAYILRLGSGELVGGVYNCAYQQLSSRASSKVSSGLGFHKS